VNDHRVSSFIDALVAGRRPKNFKANPEDVEVLRTAIELRSARLGDAIPDDKFVADLYESLKEEAKSSSGSNVRPLRARRTRATLVAVAASVALIGGTFVTTESFDQAPATTAAISVPHVGAVRTGTFEASNGEVLGQIVAYNGHPSWIYMNVGDPKFTGTITCNLQLKNGTVVAAGTVVLHQGTGRMSKSVLVDIHRLRGATLYTSGGAELATATFA
jgi:hypothetical protein